MQLLLCYTILGGSMLDSKKLVEFGTVQPVRWRRLWTAPQFGTDRKELATRIGAYMFITPVSRTRDPAWRRHQTVLSPQPCTMPDTLTIKHVYAMHVPCSDLYIPVLKARLPSPIYAGSLSCWSLCWHCDCSGSFWFEISSSSWSILLCRDTGQSIGLKVFCGGWSEMLD